jgi:hypothetical protein
MVDSGVLVLFLTEYTMILSSGLGMCAMLLTEEPPSSLLFTVANRYALGLTKVQVPFKVCCGLATSW